MLGTLRVRARLYKRSNGNVLPFAAEIGESLNGKTVFQCEEEMAMSQAKKWEVYFW